VMSWPKEVVKQSLGEQSEVQDLSSHALHSSQHNPNIMLLESMTVAFERLAGCMVLLGSVQPMLLMLNR
jgi:hypothetical protein